MSKEIWGYARISTKEQNLERQLVEIRQYVPKEENIISDKQSGKDFERTGYKALKERVREGDELYIKKSIMELVNNLLIKVFSFIAQEERGNIRRRQAEGIAFWRKTGKTKTGRPYGRPKVQFPSNWKKIYSLWKEKKLKSKEAWYLLKISKNVFYRLVKEYEGLGN